MSKFLLGQKDTEMIDFFEDEFDGFNDKLKDIVSETQLKKLRVKVLNVMRDFENLPSVLCHGDLSKKNVIVRDGKALSKGNDVDAKREVMGAITFCKQNMLHEYDMGWMMIGEYTGKGYASEAAEAFAEYFCRKHGVDGAR